MKSKEVVYYNYVPKDKIIYILGSLLVDMIYNDMIDEDVIKNKLYLYPINMLSYSYFNLLEQVYSYNKNIDLLTNDNYTYSDLLKIKKELISLLNENNIPFVKKLTKEIRLPEEGERR